MNQSSPTDPSEAVTSVPGVNLGIEITELSCRRMAVLSDRPDHWFKNVFMLAGVVLAYFYELTPFSSEQAWLVPIGFFATCIIASSNYVINEILDAPSDIGHPTKRNRPIPSGQVKLGWAYAEWIGLGILGLLLAYRSTCPFSFRPWRCW